MGKSIYHIRPNALEIVYHWHLRCHIAAEEDIPSKKSVLLILDFNTTDIGFQYY